MPQRDGHVSNLETARGLIDALNLELKYEAWPTPEEGLATRVTGLRAPTVLGANVTIPHKEAVMPMMDELDSLARRVGAVNTITNRDGRLFGANTDVEGFLRGLRDDGFDARDRRAVIAGAGGAARAVIVGLIEAGAEAIIVMNRTPDRAEKLVADVKKHVRRTWIEVWANTPENWSKATSQSQLLVNCTSLGSAGTSEENETPVPADAIRSDMLVYDLVYRPTETRLLCEAKGRGARTLGGLPMLMYQGAASFRIWTGQEPPLDVMFDAARGALEAETAAR